MAIYVTYLERREDHPKYGTYTEVEIGSEVGQLGSASPIQCKLSAHEEEGYKVWKAGNAPVLYLDESKIADGWFDWGFGPYRYKVDGDKIDFANKRRKSGSYKPYPNQHTHPLAFSIPDDCLAKQLIPQPSQAPSDYPAGSSFPQVLVLPPYDGPLPGVVGVTPTLIERT